MKGIALITGAYGQDGFYLSELLNEKGYNVYGLVRARTNVHHNCFQVIQGDILNSAFMTSTLSMILLQHSDCILEIYNFAAISSVKYSFDEPLNCANINALGPLYLLEVIRKLPEIHRKRVRFYQASSSEMFGIPTSREPLHEDSNLDPVSPYGISKAFAHKLVKCYRTSYGLYACSGILFNHESPRRRPEFVTKKISMDLTRLLLGEIKTIEVGNLNAKRDWGHAKDYVLGMWLMLQADKPGDYVLATGEHHSVRDFIELSFLLKGMSLTWHGAGLEEKGIDQFGNTVISVNSSLYRPIDAEGYLGDFSKAARILGWKPSKSFYDVVAEMVQAASAILPSALQ